LPILILIYFCIVKTKKENARKTLKYNTQRGKGREFSPRYRCFFGIYPPPIDNQLITTFCRKWETQNPVIEHTIYARRSVFFRGCLKSFLNAKTQRFFAKVAKNKCFRIKSLRSLRKPFAPFAFNKFWLLSHLQAISNT